jgi:hypothetical protein
MPRSSGNGKRFAIATFARLARETTLKHIVDVGPGLGTYGKLFGAAAPGPRWTCIEAWGPYARDYKLDSIYDRVVVSDARVVDFRKIGTADLFIFGDMLEHMEKAEAVALVGEAIASARFVLISIPVVHYPQDEIEGNPFEVHVKPDWSHEEVAASFPNIACGVVDADIGVYWLARDQGDGQMIARVAGEVMQTAQATGRYTADLGI